MPFAVETETRNATEVFRDRLEYWNRKLHLYIGLYLLFFVWLFSLSGLILNHPKWEFAQFWPSRQEQTYERSITVPQGAARIDRARDIVRQLALTGEIEWTSRADEGSVMAFRVDKPGTIAEIKADLGSRRARVKLIRTNAFGVLNALHLFTGVRDKGSERDWLMTRIWSFSMDALSAGLIFLVISGIYIWIRRGPDLASILIFIAGCAACAWFVAGFGLLR